MAPFMAYTKSSGATINDGDAGLYGSASTPAAVIASMRGADTVKRYNRAVHFSENARIGFLLVFASTVAHEVAAIRHNTGAYRVTAGLTWASLAVEIIWFAIVLSGAADKSLGGDVGVLGLVLGLQIVNFGIAQFAVAQLKIVIKPSFSPTADHKMTQDEKAPSSDAEVQIADAPQMKRSLKARHLEMIAIGGTIGTGLLKKSGKTIAASGPLGALLVFAIVGLQVYGVAAGIGEMVTYLPVSGAFSALPGRFVNKPLGFATGWAYWLNWALPGEFTAIASLMTYWVPTTTFPAWIWSAVFFIPLALINAVNVRGFGETEYALSFIKVVVISLFMIVATAVWFGAGSDSGPLWFKYWNPPIVGSDPAKQFQNFAGAFTTAYYAYTGTELVGITSAEAENPRRSVPRAINGTFWRVIIFYIGSVFLVGVILSPASTTIVGASIADSPFVYAYRQIGIPSAASIMNAVIVIAGLSAANSGFYGASRSLYGLSQQGFAPKIFNRVNKRGIPFTALLFTIAVGVLGLIAGYSIGTNALFDFLSGFTSINGMLVWVSMSVAHLRFRWGYIAQGRDLKLLPYKAPLFPYLDLFSIFVAVFVVACILFGAFNNAVYDLDWFTNDSWVYAGVPTFLVLFIGSGLFYGVTSCSGVFSGFKLIPFAELDFETGRIIETEEELAAAEEIKKKPKTRAEWIQRIKYKLF
ncbi:hypothetical protein HDU84_003719 [Entophlyctis sp. JEL0112]|nr:hypothetical protein HDU84_003719 [Entophlyctis sp. JEL0112]